jgi:hypothetical protein
MTTRERAIELLAEIHDDPNLECDEREIQAVERYMRIAKRDQRQDGKDAINSVIQRAEKMCGINPGQITGLKQAWGILHEMEIV